MGWGYGWVFIGRSRWDEHGTRGGNPPPGHPKMSTFVISVQRNCTDAYRTAHGGMSGDCQPGAKVNSDDSQWHPRRSRDAVPGARIPVSNHLIALFRHPHGQQPGRSCAERRKSDLLCQPRHSERISDWAVAPPRVVPGPRTTNTSGISSRAAVRMAAVKS